MPSRRGLSTCCQFFREGRSGSSLPLHSPRRLRFGHGLYHICIRPTYKSHLGHINFVFFELACGQPEESASRPAASACRRTADGPRSRSRSEKSGGFAKPIMMSTRRASRTPSTGKLPRVWAPWATNDATIGVHTGMENVADSASSKSVACSYCTQASPDVARDVVGISWLVFARKLI